MKRNNLLKILALTLTLSSVGTVAAYADGGYWQQSGSNWYYKDTSTGKNQTGWIQDDGYWYYMDTNGVMKTGWVYDSGNWYYLYGNGQMAKDTTINGYYLGSTGAWTTNISNSGALKSDDVQGTHELRSGLGASYDDINAGKQISSENVDLDTTSNNYLEKLSYHIAQGALTLEEAKSQCIGKTVNGKYSIKDIKLFHLVFKNTQGISPENRIKTINGSNLIDYKSSSQYVYDRYLIFDSTNNNSSEWEAFRIVVEFEAV